MLGLLFGAAGYVRMTSVNLWKICKVHCLYILIFQHLINGKTSITDTERM